MRKFKYMILVLLFVTLFVGCTKTEGEVEQLNIKEIPVEVLETMDSSMKVETCTISVKAIGTVDHHGNPLLIMRSEDEDYLDASQGFSVLEITDSLKESIKGTSWEEECPVSLEDLRYVQVLHKGIDGNVHIGGLIVHFKVAEEILDIFKELYDAGFPIQKVRPIYHYGADDDFSMEDNNTSSFNYRVVEGTNNLSKHSYGIAIDINPVQNPFVKNGNVSPEEGRNYTDRNIIQNGMVIEGDVCYNAFTSRGWIWGGNWNTIKDYQHFQKNIEVNDL